MKIKFPFNQQLIYETPSQGKNYHVEHDTTPNGNRQRFVNSNKLLKITILSTIKKEFGWKQ